MPWKCRPAPRHLQASWRRPARCRWDKAGAPLARVLLHCGVWRNRGQRPKAAGPPVRARYLRLTDVLSLVSAGEFNLGVAMKIFRREPEGNPEAGVIYVATGPDYLDLACRSARSVRALNPDLAIDLFTDAAPGGMSADFDRIHPVPRVYPRVKIDCMALSRFARTLYLDCDTLAVAPFGDLFDLLARFDLALAHDVRRNSALVQEGFAEATPYAFPQLNSGVVLYRRSPAMRAFLADWARRYREAGVLRDQITLKDLLWASDIRFYVLPPEFNLRRVTELDAWEPLDARPTLIHSHRFMDHMRDPGAERIATLDRLREVEREALRQEWAEAAPRPIAADPADPAPSGDLLGEARPVERDEIGQRRTAPRQRHLVPPEAAHRPDRHAVVRRRGHQRLGRVERTGDEIARLILAEERGACRPSSRLTPIPAAAGHLEGRERQPAVAEIRRGRDQLAVGAQELAVPRASSGEVDRRRVAVLAAEDLGEQRRLAEMAVRLADQHRDVAGVRLRRRSGRPSDREQARPRRWSAWAGSPLPSVSL